MIGGLIDAAKELVREGLFWLLAIDFVVGVAAGLVIAAVILFVDEWMAARREE